MSPLCQDPLLPQRCPKFCDEKDASRHPVALWVILAVIAIGVALLAVLLPRLGRLKPVERPVTPPAATQPIRERPAATKPVEKQPAVAAAAGQKHGGRFYYADTRRQKALLVLPEELFPDQIATWRILQ